MQSGGKETWTHCRKKQTTEYFAFTARGRGRGQPGVKYFQSLLRTVDNINSQTATAFHIIGIKVGQRRPALFYPYTRTRSILIQTTTFPYCCVLSTLATVLITVRTLHIVNTASTSVLGVQTTIWWKVDTHKADIERLSVGYFGDKYQIIPFRIYLVWRWSWMDIISFNLSVIE